jgi:hypothetical protein
LPAARPALVDIDGAGGNDLSHVFCGHPHRAAPRGGRLATGDNTQSNQSWRPGNVEEGRVGKEPLARPPDAARTDSSRKFDISATGLERPLLALNGHGEHADVCLLLG